MVGFRGVNSNLSLWWFEHDKSRCSCNNERKNKNKEESH